MAVRTVIKIQIPVFSSEGNEGPALVYNRDKTVYLEMEPYHVRKKMGKSLKKYFYADVVQDSMTIMGEAPMQDW